MNFEDVFEQQKVVPVVNFDNLQHVEPVVEILSKYGFDIIEITLRNEMSMDALALAVRVNSSATIGAGTLKSVVQIEQIMDTGAKFAFTPGINADILQTAADLKLPIIPGIATPSDAILVESFGCKYVKLFPASILGGVNYLKALSGPFPNLKFCPTGGVNNQNMADYFALDNCFAVGGSWLTPKAMLDANDWQAFDDYIKGECG